jgi:hypothetical protein
VPADRIGPIGETRGKYAGQRFRHVILRMNMKDAAIAPVQPRQHPQVLTDGNPVHAAHVLRKNLDFRLA